MQKPRRKTIKDMKSIAFDQGEWIKRVKSEARDLVEGLRFDWENDEVRDYALRQLIDNLMETCGHTDLLSAPIVEMADDDSSID